MEHRKAFTKWYFDQPITHKYLEAGADIGEWFTFEGKEMFCFSPDRDNYQRWLEHGMPTCTTVVDWLVIA